MDKKGFNLLRPQLSPEDKWEKIYDWVNGTARVVVIFVEFFVILSFAARIIVDRQARDLSEELDKNLVQLDALTSVEVSMLRLQNDLNIYSSTWENSNEYSRFVEEIYNFNPALFANIRISTEGDSSLSISGAVSKEDLSKLVDYMKSSENFDKVQLSSYVPDGEGSTSGFQIEAKMVNFKRNSLNSE